MDDTIEAHKATQGWRWIFTSARGAQFLSGSFYPTKKAALAAGQQWLSTR